MEEAVSKKSNVLPDVFAGAGVGLLLGTVMGLTTTPVVAVVVGALTSLLAVFLGLDGKASKLPAVNAVRIGAFGFATVVGLGLGLHVRINNPLAVSPEVAMQKWQQAFPENPTLARQMMVYERSAIRPASLSFAEGEADEVVVDTALASGKQALLFSGLSEFDACSRLDPLRFGSADQVLAAYKLGNPPELVQTVGAQIEGLPSADQTVAVNVAHQILCEVQENEASQ